MDFTKFLRNSYSTSENKNSNKNSKNNKHNNKNNTNIDNTDNSRNNSYNIEQDLKQSSDTIENSNLSTYKNIRKGNFVKIIKLENSELNYYKGYIGEIRDYKKDQSHALIFLHSRHNNNYISFPLTHLQKYEW